jgi:hypothetical protein
MPCDTSFLPGQTISQRKEEVRRVIKTLDSFLAKGIVKAKVGPQGGITFVGLPDDERNRVTDACAYRQLMATGSGLAKAKLAQAEAMAGRTVNRQVVGHGVHSHDNGQTWHDHKG